ncbi:hypothetical protein ACFQAS_04025 [Halopenitus salinus]|uniref:Cbb3-type cytochrome c oxidase subunit I n=1 Tax=Halopenitus salinus TaxID=1198295 RepID=A0ABD5UPY6_9EURY
MSVVPGTVETDRQPPMTVPLRHFLVASLFLLAGVIAGVWIAVGTPPASSSIAHVHLLLAGWVCVTIMGAMTQFVPVWSGVDLHSRSLATRQLQLVSLGLVGFAFGLFSGRFLLLPVFGAVMLLGFWVFVYNIARTLASVGPPSELDVTERHFAIALGFFLLLTSVGVLLAIDLVHPVLSTLSASHPDPASHLDPVSRVDVVGAHATLAVFGAVLSTVLGALYQLATMFTQTELHGLDVPLQRLEEVGYPIGVLALATGRLLGLHPLAAFGGVLVCVGLLAASVVLARRLVETRVPWTPMLSRYAVLAPAMALWALLTLPSWLRDPLATSARFGAPGTVHLLTLGVIGFVVLGTVYHVVPFIVWVHRYSDLLGFEDVPMIDDLYSDRIARTDFACFLLGTLFVVVADLNAVVGLGFGNAGVADLLRGVGGAAILVGSVAFCWNVATVVRTHSPYSIAEILFGSIAAGDADANTGSDADQPGSDDPGTDEPTGDLSTREDPAMQGSTSDMRSPTSDRAASRRTDSGGDLPAEGS